MTSRAAPDIDALVQDLDHSFSNRTAVFPAFHLASDWKEPGNPGDHLGDITDPDGKRDGKVDYLDVAALLRDLLK